VQPLVRPCCFLQVGFKEFRKFRNRRGVARRYALLDLVPDNLLGDPILIAPRRRRRFRHLRRPDQNRRSWIAPPGLPGFRIIPRERLTTRRRHSVPGAGISTAGANGSPRLPVALSSPQSQAAMSADRHASKACWVAATRPRSSYDRPPPATIRARGMSWAASLAAR
jgi:hypothetical protein